MPFETFLTCCQEMFDIFKKYGEGLTPDAKIRFLFSKINNAGLSSAVAAMKAKIATEATGSVTYVTCANHIATAVSELPENKRGRNISAITSSDSLNIYNSKGNIKTGHYPNWTDIPYDSKKLIFQERKRLGISYQPGGRGGHRGGKGNGGGGGGGRDNGGGGKRTNFGQKNRDLKATNNKLKRQVKALKKVSSKNEDDDASSQDNDAGTHFGGKRSCLKK